MVSTGSRAGRSHRCDSRMTRRSERVPYRDGEAAGPPALGVMGLPCHSTAPDTDLGFMHPETKQARWQSSVTLMLAAEQSEDG